MRFNREEELAKQVERGSPQTGAGGDLSGDGAFWNGSRYVATNSRWQPTSSRPGRWLSISKTEIPDEVARRSRKITVTQQAPASY